MLGDAAAPKKEDLGDRRDRDRRDRGGRDGGDNRGPPPVVNERFTKLAEEEKEKNLGRDFRRRDNEDGGRRDTGGDRWGSGGGGGEGGGDRGPPRPVSSRFSAA